MQFKFLKIPVQIHPSFWLLLVFFADFFRNFSVETAIWSGVLVMSLLLHEYGHALTARYFGKEPTITLWALGGYAQYDTRGIKPSQDFFITLNGPVFTALLIGIPYALLKLSIFSQYPYIQYFLFATLRLNLFWCLLNLIPVVPLDGGHLLRNLLQRKWGMRGERTSMLIGLLTVLVAVPLLYYQGWTFFGTLLLINGFQNFQALRALKAAPETTASPYSSYVAGVEAIKNNELEKAKLSLKTLVKSSDTQIRHSAIEALAKAYYLGNEHKKAYQLLLTADHQFLKEGKVLLCRLADACKNYTLIARHAFEIYSLESTYEIALLNSKAFAFLKKPTLAGGWLMTAAQFGEEEKKGVVRLLGDALYDGVRDDTAFQEATSKIEV